MNITHDNDERLMKIGIAVTTHNRPEVCRETFEILNNWRPDNSIIGIVDDGSIMPPFGFNVYNIFRFDESYGIGTAKNKCLELLYDTGCTHFFLFDDDCRPIVNKWWDPYINSGLNHACWNYNRESILPLVGGLHYVEYEKPNGCMLFFTRKCLQIAGGWDLDFKGYGYEHVNLSDRIYNLGLTPARYIDVPNSKHLFELADCESSFSYEDRAQIPNNLALYQQKYYSKEFKPFR